MNEKFIKKIVIGLLALVFLVVLPLACCSVVRQRERGVQYTFQREQWKYKVDLKRAEKWNGVEISNQSIYVPNTYDLRTGK